MNDFDGAIAISMVLLVVVVIGVLFSIGMKWGGLSDRFYAAQPVEGTKWHFQRMRIGWIEYGELITLTTNEKGLGIKAHFTVMQAPLFIPWEEFHNPRITQGLFRRTLEIDVGNPKIDTIALAAEIFETSEGRKILSAQHALAE